MCRFNCRLKMNPTQKFLLEAECTDCEQFLFLWELYAYRERNSNQDDVISEIDEKCFEYGKNTDRLKINPGCLLSGVKYNVKLIATAISYSLEAKYAFIVNIEPKPGNCSVIPNSGETMRTRFSVACTEFKDIDQPILYSFIFDNKYNYNSTVENNLPQGYPGYLLRSRHAPVIDNVFMPVGNPDTNYSATVTIEAVDSYGMSVSVVKDITVQPYSDLKIEDLTHFFHSKEEGSFYDILNVQGDVEGALNLVVCGAQILKLDDAPDITREQKAKVKESLVKQMHEIPVESFNKAEQSIFVLDAVLDGDPKEITPQAADDASNLLDRLTKNLRKHITDEETNPADTFKASLSAMTAAASLFTVGSTLDTTPTVASNATESPITKERKQLCKAGSKVLDVFKDLSDVMMDKVVEGEAESFADIKDIKLRMRKDEGKRNITTTIGIENVGKTELPILKDLANKSGESVFEMTTLVLPSSPYMCSNSSNLMNSYVLTIDVDVVTEQGKSKVKDISSQVSQKMSYFIKRKGLPESVNGTLTTKRLPRLDTKNVKIHEFHLTTKNITTHILIDRNNTNFTLLVTWTYKEHPVAEDFSQTEFVVTERNSSRHLITLLQEDYFTPEAGTYYVGLLPYTESVQYALRREDNLFFKDKDMDLDYNISIFVSRCLHHDDDDGAWKEDGCAVSNRTTLEMIACDCVHLSTFGGSFLVAPNTLDLSKIPELFATASENLVVIIYMSVCWLLFFLLLLWAVRKDRHDTRNRKILYLEDNNRTDKFGYIIAIQTGLRWNAGTTSKISIKLHGKKYVTKEIFIKSKERPILQTGKHDWFFFINDTPLRDIIGLRLFIKFQGPRPNWFLSQIRIKDLTTGNFWVFLVNEWYIADQNESTVDDYYVPLTVYELRKFNIVLERRVVDDLRDRHLWFSIFSIPSRSTFSRAQRLMAAFSLFLFANLLNIMFYNAEPEEPAWFVRKYKLFFFTFDVNDFIISIESALIALPYGILILELFMRVKYTQASFNDHIEIINELEETGYGSDVSEHDYSTSSGESMSSKNSVDRQLASQLRWRPSNELMQKIFSRREYNFIPSTDDNFYASKKSGLALPSKTKDGNSFGDGLFDVRDSHYPIPMWTWMDFSPTEIVAVLDNTEMEEELRCKHLYLPYCFVYVAWFVAITVSLTCTFFIILYGLTYGYAKSLKWLSTNLFSFGESTVVLDPLHVFVFAVITTYCIQFTSSL